jgi:tyrosyl-tRNA synthetase
MMAKDSVKSRLETGMSFTEFSYQLVQGYDFYYLWRNQDVKLQMGGSDQWGNMLTGTELIRRKGGGEAFALTTPLIKKADGTKFGKTENGNIWLDPQRTSPYRFYQFWLNASDQDSKSYIRIFTLMNKEQIEALEKSHNESPEKRILQKTLAKDITIRVHSEHAFLSALEASEILFGNGTAAALNQLTEDDLLAVFDGVPQKIINKTELENGFNIIEFLSDKTMIFSSRGEAKKMIQGGGTFINKEKVEDLTVSITIQSLLKEKYILVQKGKKNYFLVIAQ